MHAGMIVTPTTSTTMTPMTTMMTMAKTNATSIKALAVSHDLSDHIEVIDNQRADTVLHT